MSPVLREIRRNPLLWLLVFVPTVLAAEKLKPQSHTLLFVLAVLAILPLATLLSHATQSVAAKTGDSVGGLLNSTLGNLTELVIAITALQAGQYTLVKASIAGAIVTNALFMLGVSFLLGGARYHLQEYNRVGARFQAGLLFLATVALLIPSTIGGRVSLANQARFNEELSLALSILLLVAYALGLLFSLKTHGDLFAGGHEEAEAAWPIGLAVGTLAGVTVLVALVSEIFVSSVQQAAVALGLTPAFVGFIVVSLVGGAAEMAAAFSAARKNHLDLSISIALGSAAQIALFVAPVLVLLSLVLGPTPMDLNFWPGAVVLPDNVLFEGGAGETIRRALLKQADVHTLLRLPTGIFYAQGVKANVLFFDRKPAQERPWTSKLRIYDLRTNLHFTLKENTLKRSDLDAFVNCYFGRPAPVASAVSAEKSSKRSAGDIGRYNRFDRVETERFKSYTYEELIKRDKANLDIFWLKDEALEESANLPAPEIIAADIVEDLQAALAQFAEIAADLKRD